MEDTIETLKEILYFTNVGDNNKYAEALLNVINELDKSEIRLPDPTRKNLTLAKYTSSMYEKEFLNE